MRAVNSLSQGLVGCGGTTGSIPTSTRVDGSGTTTDSGAARTSSTRGLT